MAPGTSTARLTRNLLRLPPAPNPSKKTWTWIGVGTLAIAGLGAVYYRGKRCDLPKLPDPRAQEHTSVHTLHPNALTAAQLSTMKAGDKVGVAVGLQEAGGAYNLVPGQPVTVVRGKLGTGEDGIADYGITCFKPNARSPLITSGPVSLPDGTTRDGYGQYAGLIFPIEAVGTIIEPQYIHPLHLA